MVKNLIYQYWLGTPGDAVKYGVENMRTYAERIGAEYQFKTNPRWAQEYTDIPQYYNAFEPIWGKRFEEYDNILFADTDVFAVEGLQESIFDQDIGINNGNGIWDDGEDFLDVFAFGAKGFSTNHITIVPSYDLVIVRNSLYSKNINLVQTLNRW